VLFNTQWFVSYLPDYRDGFTVNGPVNVFFTFACRPATTRTA
jgi:hypothetical protein